MACCGKQRKRFIVNVKARKPAIQPLTEIPDAELAPKQLRIKKRMLMMDARKKRMALRNARATRIKARNDRKALNN